MKKKKPDITLEIVTVNTSGSKGLTAGSLQLFDYCKHTTSGSWMTAPAEAPSY